MTTLPSFADIARLAAAQLPLAAHQVARWPPATHTPPCQAASLGTSFLAPRQEHGS